MDSAPGEKTPKIIYDLVERFERNLSEYKSTGYKEDQLRQEFINPFFEVLGWDVSNRSGASPAHRDVIHEDSIKVSGGGTKAPDYCFTLSGKKMFFVETKKPSVGIDKDPHPAYQLRRYAWSADLAVSILTNFEQFIVYESRQKPKESDKVAVGRISIFSFREYIEKWDEIASIFSYTAVKQGSFDRFIESAKQKRGTQQVGDEFLKEIEGWREELAKNIALRNPQLSVNELNNAVQSTIDRIIFLRMCEDRGIEPYGQLQGLLKNENVYKGLCKIYEKADEKYNSGLFHFSKEKGRSTPHDEITLKLVIDDKVLEDIIKNIYYPDSPYEFSVLRPEILGNVYEQFLGKVIRLTEGHRAKVDEKPAVKKAGGVYYTPEYIVNYIVKNTVGKLCEGKTPKQIENLHILDPACGSGSFLLGAYSYLLEHHLNYYIGRKNPKSLKEQIYQRKDGQWILTVKEKKRILLNNIYGVDIDSQAVEVTKLSLLLKVLEGASRDVFEQQQKLWMERALPDLTQNIKCGNSLIEPNNLSQSIFINSPEEIIKINAFSYQKEFENIFNDGGFDVIIGNPPYVNAWTLYEDQPELRDYINESKIFNTAERHWDLYILFIERSMQLIKSQGRISFIIPFSYAIQKYARSSRNNLIENYTLESIADLRSIKVFKNVPVITIIPVIINQKPNLKNNVSIRKPIKRTLNESPSIESSLKIKQMNFLKTNEEMLRLDLSENAVEICNKILEKSIFVDDICWVNYGAQMSSREKGKFGKEFVIRHSAESKECRRTVSGRNLYRYSVQWSGDYVDWSLSNQMYGPRNPNFFELPKLMIRDITGTHRLELTMDSTGLYCDHTILCAQLAKDAKTWMNMPDSKIKTSERYTLELLVGILASKLISAYYYLTLTGEGVRIGGGFHTYPKTIRKLPIIDLSRIKNKEKSILKIESNVKNILSLKNALHKLKDSNEKEAIIRQINALDQEVDSIVYEIFNLKQDEIKVMENFL